MASDIDPGVFLVFTGGGPVPERHRGTLPDAACTIAADAGLDLAHALGRRPDVVVGDLDSVSRVALERAVSEGAEVEEHDRDKDATDFELALAAARRRGARRVVVVGGGGGRLDHLLANMLVVTAGAWDGIEIEAFFGAARVWVCRSATGASRLGGEPGEYVSLLAVGGAAHEVHTTGLRWPLRGETLAAGSGRGVSNEFSDRTATVRLGAGTILAVAPGTEADSTSHGDPR